MEIPKPDELEMKSWGSRADFFARLPSCSRPDVDWRSALTPRVRQAIPAWSQGFEDLVLRDFFQEKTGGVFLDIGCAWPQKCSTTCYVERVLKWTGIAVDALAEYGKNWQQQRPNSKFMNFVVSDKSGETVKFFRHDWTVISSLAKDQVLKHGEEELITEIEVQTITLNDILKMQKIENFDHLTLDVEGSEADALRGFDIRKYEPKLCCIEKPTEEVFDYFADNNYELIGKYRKVDKINSYFCPA